MQLLASQAIKAIRNPSGLLFKCFCQAYEKTFLLRSNFKLSGVWRKVSTGFAMDLHAI